MKKRFLAEVLTLCILIMCMSAGIVPISADNTEFEYRPKSPELPILNAIAGNDSKFYDKIQAEYDNPFNIANDLFNLSEGTVLNADYGYLATVMPESSMKVLNEIKSVRSNLKINMSATLNSAHHTHHKYSSIGEVIFLGDYTSDVFRYEVMSLLMGEEYIVTLSGFVADTNGTPRMGQYMFFPLPLDGPLEGLIKYNAGSKLDGNGKPCTHAGITPSINNVFLALMDDRAPKLKRIGGTISTQKHFKAGDEMTIELEYDEPIRFANGNPDKDNLPYINLELQGETSSPKATLNKLIDNTLYFSYTVPDDYSKSSSITSLDLSKLGGTDVELRYVYKDIIFDGKEKDEGDSNTDGYSTTTSYITDLAGNPISTSSKTITAYIDGEAPFIGKITAKTNANNIEIKRALARESQDESVWLADKSDTHFGIGDTITYTVEMNEVLNIHKINISGTNSAKEVYTEVLAETNIEKMVEGEWKPVTLKSQYTYTAKTEREDYGLGASNNKVTCIEFEPLIITGDMRCNNAASGIKLTNLVFENNEAADFAGNTLFNSSGTGADSLTYPLGDKENTLAYYLDVDFSKVKTDFTPDEGKYSVVEEGNGFRFPIEISDFTNDSGYGVKSGVNGIEGTLAWLSPDKQLRPYELAVTTSEELSNDVKWTTERMNFAARFIQVGEQKQWVHIRLVSGCDYALKDTELIVIPEDYAGNSKGNLALNNSYGNDARYKLDLIIDNVAPKVSAEKVSRSLKQTGGGILEVDVTLSDSIALNTAEYLWGDQESPSASSDWKSFGEQVYGLTSVSATAVADIGIENFSKHLWINMTDTSGNQTIVDLGVLSYNLSKVKYELEYSDKITSKASLKVSNLDSDSTLIFMIPTDVQGEYFVRAFTDDIVNEAQGGIELFTLSSDKSEWRRMTVTEEDGNYTFTDRITDNTALNDILLGWFSGTLTITIMSGISEAIAISGSTLPSYAGIGLLPTSTDKVSLRVSSSQINMMEEQKDMFEDMQFTTDEAAAPEVINYAWSSFRGDSFVRSTPEGLTVSIDLGKDINGWNYEDVDFNSSCIRLENIDTGSTVTVPILNSPVQEIVLPSDDDLSGISGKYETGIYEVYLDIACTAGRDYSIPLTDRDGNIYKMYIDATKPSKDFDIYSLTYQSKIALIEDKQNYYLGADVTYMPYAEGIVEMYVSVPEPQPEYANHYAGAYNALVWNSTTEADSHASAANPCWETNTQNGLLKFDVVIVDDKEAAKAKADELAGNSVGNRNKLILIKDTLNVVELQVLHANEKYSEIKKYKIYPVSNIIRGAAYATNHKTGGNVVDEGKLVFTPSEKQSMTNIDVYCCAYIDNVLQSNEKMTPENDVYTSPLLPGDNVCYYLYGMDQNDVTFMVKEDNFYNRQIQVSGAKIDEGAPEVTLLDNTVTDNIFNAEFRIDDDTISAVRDADGSSENAEMPISVRLYFDSEYAERLGAATSPELTLDFGGEESYLWEATKKQDTGLYKVSAERMYDSDIDKWYYNVKVTGAVYCTPDSGNTTALTLYMDAVDDFGYMSTGSATYTNDKNVATKAYVDVSDYMHAPEYSIVHGAGGWDMGLTLQFNAPVQPAASWKCPNPSGFSAKQTDVFPISNDGTQSISFYDIFGILHTQEFTLEALYHSGINLSISTLAQTDEAVTVTASNTDMDQNGTILIFSRGADGTQPLAPSGDTAQDTPGRNKSLTVTENGVVTVCRYYKEFTYDELYNQGKLDNCDRLDIHITNITHGAPEATPHFYFQENATEYNATNLPEGETKGNVRVWYTTDRHVTPTDGTFEEVTFRYDDAKDSYTFKYLDDFDNEGSLTVDLSELGITLAAPDEVEPDISAPQVKAEVYAKRFASYLPVGGINQYTEAQGIKQMFDDIGYVQDYSLKLSVKEDSNYKTVLLKNVPTSLSYASAVSDSIEGVSLIGNTIAITKPVSFTVAVVDNAKSETSASGDNYTYITISEADIGNWFDNTPPQAETVTIPTDLYERTMYVSFSDRSDSGADMGKSVTPISPALSKEEYGDYKGMFKKIFTDNIKDKLIFQDAIGNIAEKEIGVSDLNTSPPKLTVEWLPSYIEADGTADSSAPPQGPVNTDIIARVKSDMPIADVVMEYTEDKENWITDFTDISWVTLSLSSNTLSVTFIDSDCGVRLTVTAANGKKSTVMLYLSKGIIDKIVPTVTEKIDYQYRAGATAPYSAIITLTPDEPTRFTNSGESGKLYDSENPLTFTRNDNTEKTYYFIDKAGNFCDLSIKTDKIDTVEPIITTTPENTLNLPNTSGDVTVTVSVNEKCTIECNEEKYTLSSGEHKDLVFTENGAYALVVTDMAGNRTVESIIIGTIDKTIPQITFNKSTLIARQGISALAMENMLKSGVSAWDNDKITPPEWNYDSSELDTNTPGLYEVPYTITDSAGNQNTNLRHVSIYDKDEPCILIDDEIVGLNGTAVLKAGTHNLKVTNLKEIAPSIPEPYAVKIRKGLGTGAQMKYFEPKVLIDSRGEFTVVAGGYYTLYLVTQSRQTYLIQLYVEK